MNTNIYRVVSQGDVTYVPSSKEANGQLAKSVIRLKEFGGKYENEYLVTLLGNLASCVFYAGELVVASLRFQVHEVNGQQFQDIVANDLTKISK